MTDHDKLREAGYEFVGKVEVQKDISYSPEFKHGDLIAAIRRESRADD